MLKGRIIYNGELDHYWWGGGDLKPDTRPEKLVKLSLLLILGLIISCLMCKLVTWRSRAIVLDIPKPPGSQVTAGFRWANIGKSIWEEQVLIPKDTFESPEEVQQYYTTELAGLGWFPISEEHSFLLNPGSCNYYAGLADDQSLHYSLEMYEVESGPLRNLPPEPPVRVCLYVQNSTSDGFYIARLITVMPSIFDEINE